MKFSIYFYLFNCELRDFNAAETVANFCQFADEIICATVPSQDNTRVILADLEKQYSNFKVIDTDIQIEGNNRFDGQLKTAALKNCTNPIRIIADADERFIVSQRPLWDKYAKLLMENPDVDGLLLPVIDLYSSREQIRSNHQIGQKFRIHKDTIVERGVLPQAELGNGLFRTDMSDSTEPKLVNGQLGNFASVVNPMFLNPFFCEGLKQYPIVIHEGFLDLQRRAKIGKEFWKKCWEERSGKEENVATSEKELELEPTIFHNLEISQN